MTKRIRQFVVTAALLPLAAAYGLYRMTGTAGLLDWVPKYRAHFIVICLAGSPAAFLYAMACLADRSPRAVAAAVSRILSRAALAVSAVVIAAALIGPATYLLLSRSIDPSRARDFRRPGIETGERAVLPVSGPDTAAGSGSSAGASASDSSRTPLLRLAFSSDMHAGNPESSPEASRRIVKAVSGSGFDAFFVLGDLAEMGFPGNDFENALDILSEANAALPIIALMGNHDSIIGGTPRFHRYFNPARYFHLEANGVHIVAIELLWGHESLDRRQEAWLRKTLSSIPGEETLIVLSHCFMRSSGYVDAESGRAWYDHEETIASVAPLLEEAGVDLVVSGHNHYLEYLEAGAIKPEEKLILDQRDY